MLQQAAKSLEDFLKANIDKIKQNSSNANVLREAWLKIHPEYQQYDLQLDIEWQDCTDEIRGCLDGCCPWVPPQAKSFRVFSRDWDDERYIANKSHEHSLYPNQPLVDAVKEDLAWESEDFYTRLSAGKFVI